MYFHKKKSKDKFSCPSQAHIIRTRKFVFSLLFMKIHYGIEETFSFLTLRLLIPYNRELTNKVDLHVQAYGQNFVRLKTDFLISAVCFDKPSDPRK